MQAFYLPWAMLAMDVIFGSPLLPDVLGILSGHLYYFLTVLHPLAGGRKVLTTPRWVYPLLYYLIDFVAIISVLGNNKLIGNKEQLSSSLINATIPHTFIYLTALDPSSSNSRDII